MDGICECGSYKCYAEVYWKGNYYRYRRDGQGDVFTYDKTVRKLIEVNNGYAEGGFQPFGVLRFQT